MNRRTSKKNIKKRLGLHTDLPLHQDANTRFLPFIIGVMVFLATLALAATFSLNSLADRWDREFGNGATVEIIWPDDMIAEMREQSLERVLRVINSAEGVEKAEVVSEEQTSALLEPWLGEDIDIESLPLPQLIEISFDRPSAELVEVLDIQLQGVVEGAHLTSHQEWLSNLRDMAEIAKMIALGLLLISTLSSIVTVSFATHASLAMHADMVELLHTVGASDKYVAGQFQRHALMGGVLGGFFGFLPAVLMIIFGGLYANSGGGGMLAEDVSVILPDMALTYKGWLGLCLVPIIGSLIAMFAARFTVLRKLGKML